MLDLIVAPLARQDMIEIGDYISRNNPTAAKKIILKLDTGMSRLLEVPFLGPAADAHLPAGLRKLSIPPYIIFYRVLSEYLQVVRVLHGSREIDERLLR